MNLTSPQSQLFTSDAKATAMVSGFGAGKTAAAITRMLATKFMYPSVNLLYCAPTYSLIRDILYPEIAEALAAQNFIEGQDFVINRSTASSEIVFNGAGKILCRTMDRPDRLVGFQVGDAFLDEFDTLPADKAKFVWIKVLARARKHFPDGKRNQMFVTTTPEGFKETYRMFKKEKREGYRLITAATNSNPHLPEDYVETLRAAYPDQLIDAYLEGKFVNLTSGSVYYAFNRKRCDTKYVQRPRETLHIGMDFNVNHMAAIVHIMRDNVLYAVDEIIDLRDTPDMITELIERYTSHPVLIYPDASGNSKSSKGATLSDHKLLKDAGFRVRSNAANPFIRDRLASMNAGFQHENYKVNTEKCPIYTECLEQQTYDKNGAPDKSNDLDHPVDAGGYCKHYLLPIIANKVSTKVLGGF